MINSTINLDEFETLLSEDDLPDEALKVIQRIIGDVRPVAQSFHPNTDELLNLAAKHSPTYAALPLARKSFFDGVMKMPVFFFCNPQDTTKE